MSLDLIKSLTKKKPVLSKSTEPVIAPVAQPPAAAPTITAMVGLVKTGTPVPMDSRTTSKKLAFEEEPTKKKMMLDRMRKGFVPKVVIKACGWSSMWGDWKRRAAKGLEPYATFMLEVEAAQAEGACHLLDQIERAGEGAPDQHGVWKNQWQASKFLLEVNDPTTFKPVERSLSVNVSATADQMRFDVSQMTDEDLETLVEIGDRAPVIDAEIVSEG